MAGKTTSLLVKAVDDSLVKIHELLPEEHKHLVIDLGKRIGAMAKEKYEEGQLAALNEVKDAHHQ